jgi:hypothetical protein
VQIICQGYHRAPAKESPEGILGVDLPSTVWNERSVTVNAGLDMKSNMRDVGKLDVSGPAAAKRKALREARLPNHFPKSKEFTFTQIPRQLQHYCNIVCYIYLKFSVMATPGFGFSFGDFVAAIKLVNDIRRALRNTGGAKDEFKHVYVDLQHLEILLDHLNRGIWDQGGDAGHLNAVKGMAFACKIPLQEFLAKMEKYKSLRSHEMRGFRGTVGVGKRKIQWEISMKEEVEKFRALIVAKVVAINMLLQLHTM